MCKVSGTAWANIAAVPAALCLLRPQPLHAALCGRTSHGGCLYVLLKAAGEGLRLHAQCSSECKLLRSHSQRVLHPAHRCCAVAGDRAACPEPLGHWRNGRARSSAADVRSHVLLIWHSGGQVPARAGCCWLPGPAAAAPLGLMSCTACCRLSCAPAQVLPGLSCCPSARLVGPALDSACPPCPAMSMYTCSTQLLVTAQHRTGGQAGKQQQQQHAGGVAGLVAAGGARLMVSMGMAGHALSSG